VTMIFFLSNYAALGVVKVARVPGVVEGLFNLRLVALAAELKKPDGEKLLYRCSLCEK